MTAQPGCRSADRRRSRGDPCGVGPRARECNVSQNDDPEARQVTADPASHVPVFSGDVDEMAPHYYGADRGQ